MQKQIKDLQPGEIFVDSLGAKLKVEKLGEVKPLPSGRDVVRVYLVTEGGTRMYMNYPANREVAVIK